VGIGTGILVDDINGLAASDKAAAAPLVEEFTDNILIRGPSVSSRASAASHSEWPGSRPVLPSAAKPAHPSLSSSCSDYRGFPSPHPPPDGPAGLVLVTAAVLLFVRSQAVPRAPARVTQPGPAWPMPDLRATHL
jgi:hypothetical protein